MRSPLWAKLVYLAAALFVILFFTATDGGTKWPF